MDKSMQETLVKKENDVHDYGKALSDFVDRNRLRVLIDDGRISFCFDEKALEQQSESPAFIDNPKSPQGADLLGSREYLNTFFNEEGFTVALPKPIVNKGGTTFFTCAGVQVLDDVIYREADIDVPLFVAQPVIRSQFAGQTKDGTTTSFVNVCTEAVNQPVASHFASLECWIKFLTHLGFEKEEFVFYPDFDEPKWGNKKFKCHMVRVRYQKLSIGDAMFLYDVPQDSRGSLVVSDIGFGLERLKWVLKGGNYRSVLFPGADLEKIPFPVLDYCRTLALFAGSGVVPSNSDEGYRFRQFSKKLMVQTKGMKFDLEGLFGISFSEWGKWISLEEIEKARSSFMRENTRNFNGLLIGRLKGRFPDINIDINRPTEELIKLLRGTSVRDDRNYLELIWRELTGN